MSKYLIKFSYKKPLFRNKKNPSRTDVLQVILQQDKLNQQDESTCIF